MWRRWGLKTRWSWAFLWRMMFFILSIFFLYIIVVLVAFNDISELFNPKPEQKPRDILVHAVEHSQIKGQKAVIAPASLKRIDAKKGWLQVLDKQGREIYAYKKPKDFPVHYQPSELDHLKKNSERERGYTLYTWYKTVQGKPVTFILGELNVNGELLYRIRTSTQRDGKGVHLSARLLRELDQRGLWLQILDEKGTVVYQHQAEKQLRSYPPGVFVDYIDDQDVIYQEGALGRERYIWLTGAKEKEGGDQDVLASDGSIKDKPDWEYLYFLILGLFVLMVAYLFGNQFGQPMLHLMNWIQELAQGHYREPVNKKGRPRSLKANGKLRRSYRIYKEVVKALKDLTHTLKQNEERWRRLEKTREDWIAGISHDLRTPLSSVKGYADLLAEERYEWEPAEVRRYAEVIRDKAEYMEQLIADLNLTFRLKNDALPLKLTEQDLVEVVRQTVIDVMNDWQSASAHFTFHPAVPHIQSAVDKQWFQRALKNLLVNAIQHNPPGTEVTVSVGLDQGRLVIEVEDNGRGMDEETLAMLFERYYRGTNTAKQNQGTGLGMAIAKQLIEAHGGEIDIDSQIGRGTTMRIYLAPLKEGVPR